MVDELNELARWTIYLIRASHDFRNHACEFSQYLVRDVTEDYWPDIAEQLIRLLDDVDHVNRRCVELVEPLRAQLARSVSEFKLPKPEGHLSWTLWTVDHWNHLTPIVKMGLLSRVSVGPSSSEHWFHEIAIRARLEPQRCLAISKYLFSLADRFIEFDDKDALIEKVKRECVAVHAFNGLPMSMVNSAPGTVITRMYKGKELRVAVLDDGYDFQGEHFKTLSALAKHITGSHCSGNAFFGLRKPK